MYRGICFKKSEETSLKVANLLNSKINEGGIMKELTSFPKIVAWKVFEKKLCWIHQGIGITAWGNREETVIFTELHQAISLKSLLTFVSSISSALWLEILRILVLFGNSFTNFSGYTIWIFFIEFIEELFMQSLEELIKKLPEFWKGYVGSLMRE